MSNILNVNSIITFGKYKETMVIDVIAKDLNYIIWCIKSIDDFIVSDDVFIEILFNRSKIVKNNFEIEMMLNNNDPKLVDAYLIKRLYEYYEINNLKK
jgi:hypothetical protein